MHIVTTDSSNVMQCLSTPCHIYIIIWCWYRYFVLRSLESLKCIFQYGRSLSVVGGPPQSVVLQQLYILYFLKTTRPVVTIFGLKHIQDKRNPNCDIYTLLLRGLMNRLNRPQKEATFSKLEPIRPFQAFPHTCRKNCTLMMLMRP